VAYSSPRVRRLLAFALLGLVVAACGGGGARLSKTEYAKRADAICARYEQAIRALGQPKSLDELTAFTDKAVPIAQKAVDDAARLRPPKDEEKLAESWHAVTQKVVDAIGRLGAAARKGDQNGAKAALAAGDTANTNANNLGRQLGMDACTKD
jgi:hypothetical protein